jgi:hypothetical protein
MEGGRSKWEGRRVVRVGDSQTIRFPYRECVDGRTDKDTSRSQLRNLESYTNDERARRSHKNEALPQVYANILMLIVPTGPRKKLDGYEDE